jgi:hypothetical protein
MRRAISPSLLNKYVSLNRRREEARKLERLEISVRTGISGEAKISRSRRKVMPMSDTGTLSMERVSNTSDKMRMVLVTTSPPMLWPTKLSLILRRLSCHQRRACLRASPVVRFGSWACRVRACFFHHGLVELAQQFHQIQHAKVGGSVAIAEVH